MLLLREAAAFQCRRRGEIGGAGPDGADGVPRSLVLTPGLLLQVTLIRLLWMVPAAVAAVWGTSRLVAAAYHQLILPDDLTVPLALRVLRDAGDAAAVVAATWLVGETFSGLAVRRLIVSRGSVPGALGWAIVAPLRRPLTTAATLALGTVGLLLAVGPPVLLANLLWRRLQVLLDGDQSAILTVVATAGLVAAWGLGLLLVGSIAAWRSLAWSFEVLRAGREAEVPARTERPFDPPSMVSAGGEARAFASRPRLGSRRRICSFPC